MRASKSLVLQSLGITAVVLCVVFCMSCFICRVSRGLVFVVLLTGSVSSTAVLLQANVLVKDKR